MLKQLITSVSYPASCDSLNLQVECHNICLSNLSHSAGYWHSRYWLVWFEFHSAWGWLLHWLLRFYEDVVSLIVEGLAFIWIIARACSTRFTSVYLRCSLFIIYLVQVLCDFWAWLMASGSHRCSMFSRVADLLLQSWRQNMVFFLLCFSN